MTSSTDQINLRSLASVETLADRETALEEELTLTRSLLRAARKIAEERASVARCLAAVEDGEREKQTA